MYDFSIYSCIRLLIYRENIAGQELLVSWEGMVDSTDQGFAPVMFTS